MALDRPPEFDGQLVRLAYVLFHRTLGSVEGTRNLMDWFADQRPRGGGIGSVVNDVEHATAKAHCAQRTYFMALTLKVLPVGIVVI